MKLNPAASWQQQCFEKQQTKLAWQQEKSTGALPLLQKNTKKPSAIQRGLSLNDVLSRMLPGGVAGLNKAGGTTGLSKQPPTEAEQRKLGEIDLKMKTGAKLSDEEMKLLATHNPMAYQKAKMIKAEREQYQKELSQCRTKEDVEKLRQRKVQQFSAEMQSIQQSGMSKGDKEKAAEFLMMRMAATGQEFKAFTESEQYKSLPSERAEEMRRAAEEQPSLEDSTEELAEAAETDQGESGESAENAPAKTEDAGGGAPSPAGAEPRRPGKTDTGTETPAKTAHKAKAPKAAAPQTPAPQSPAAQGRTDLPFSITV